MQVLKAFKYSKDGVNLIALEPGDDPSDVPADLVKGLTDEGYLGDGKPAKAKPVPETKVIEAAPENTAAAAPEDKAE